MCVYARTSTGATPSATSACDRLRYDRTSRAVARRTTVVVVLATWHQPRLTGEGDGQRRRRMRVVVGRLILTGAEPKVHLELRVRFLEGASTHLGQVQGLGQAFMYEWRAISRGALAPAATPQQRWSGHRLPGAHGRSPRTSMCRPTCAASRAAPGGRRARAPRPHGSRRIV